MALRETENINQIITLPDCYKVIYCNVHQMGPSKTDHNKWLIALAMMALSGWTLKVRWALCYVITDNAIIWLIESNWPILLTKSSITLYTYVAYVPRSSSYCNNSVNVISLRLSQSQHVLCYDNFVVEWVILVNIVMSISPCVIKPCFLAVNVLSAFN